MLIRAQRPMKADAGECEAQEQPLLWTGAFYFISRKATVIAVRLENNSTTLA